MQRNVNLIESDRSRQEFSNEYLVPKCGFDTVENKSTKVCQKVVTHNARAGCTAGWLSVQGSARF